MSIASKLKNIISASIIILFLSSTLQRGQVQITPPITPKWALGHIVWEDSINTQEAALNLIKLYKEHNIPVSGIIIDSPWSLSYNDFNWDKTRYPNPVAMINELKKENIKVILWLTGCINSDGRDVPVDKSPDYDFAKNNGYVVNNGKESHWWKGNGMHLDFTNRDAVKWWNKKLDKVFVDGVYGWKVDQGESSFGDTIITSLGKMPQTKFRKYYYNSMFNYATSKQKEEGIILARPYSHQTSLDGFAASISKMSVGWCGDFSGDWSGLKLQLNNIYKSAEAGYGALGCEIGGFSGKRATKTQLIRYVQFASMVATMINGGANGAFRNHLPWFHDNETTDIYRYYVNLHFSLRNYIFSTLVDAHINGSSLLKDVSFNEESHKLGNDIFFKAITSDTNKVTFTLPEGNDWIDFWTDKKYTGGTKIKKEYKLKFAPIFIKAGAILPLEISNNILGIGDKSFAEKITVLIYPDKQNKYLFHKPLGDGINYEDISISYNDERISVNSSSKHSFVFFIINENGRKKVERKGKKFEVLIEK